MGFTRVCVWKQSFLIILNIRENMKNMKTCADTPLLLSNRLPEMYLNNPKSDTRMEDLVQIFSCFRRHFSWY
jgi:hypothetical protein